MKVNKAQCEALRQFVDKMEFLGLNLTSLKKYASLLPKNWLAESAESECSKFRSFNWTVFLKQANPVYVLSGNKHRYNERDLNKEC
ncbi:hypothetical protein [Peribacillus frigoritolerans]|uniref:hypothetical protein n=1 Tax=Peribacillus frigoritolerans TaxID=450367 RepID=UPI0033059F57